MAKEADLLGPAEADHEHVDGLRVGAWPGATALAIIWVIGIHAIICGLIEVVFSFKVQEMSRSLEPQPAT